MIETSDDRNNRHTLVIVKLIWMIAIQLAKNLCDVGVRVCATEGIASAIETKNELLELFLGLDSSGIYKNCVCHLDADFVGFTRWVQKSRLNGNRDNLSLEDNCLIYAQMNTGKFYWIVSCRMSRTSDLSMG